MFLFFNPLMAQEDSSANDNVEMVEEGTTDGDSAQVEEVQEPAPVVEEKPKKRVRRVKKKTAA